MNRKHLDALLIAGLITAAEHAQHLAAGTRPQLQLETAAQRISLEVDAASGALTIEGDIVAYEEYIVSHGMIVHAGALVPRQPIENVKMLRDHDQHDPIGYMASIDDQVLHAAFTVAPEQADAVRAGIKNKTRDGLSVGFITTDYDIDDDWTLHVNSAELYEVSLCACPAVNSARITNVAAALATQRKENHTMNRAQLAAALTAGTITQEQHDAALAALTATELQAPTPGAAPAPAEVVAGPELQTQEPTAIHTQPRRRNLAQVTQHIAAAFNSMNLREIELAISDVVPADDAGAGFLREDWLGELWRAEEVSRPWIDAIGAPEPMTALKGKGWNWGDEDGAGDGGEPHVDEYAGDKTEVPSNEIGTKPTEFTGFRIAAGWDVDRAFEDFADPEFTSSFWAATMRDYKRKSNTGIRTRALAAATAPGAITAALGGTATVAAGGVLAILKQVVRDIRKIDGGRANRIFLGDDLFAELEDLPTENLPLWLKSAAIGLDIAEGSADIGTLRILNDSSLAAEQVTAFDNRALKVKEKSPIQLRAINIPNGGIDLGFFGYLRLDTHDKRVVVKRTYGEALPV